MDNPELPHQETLVRLYELRAMLDHGAEIAADHLPPHFAGKLCDDCSDHRADRSYGRVNVCRRCAVQRLTVAAKLLGGDEVSH